MSQVNERPGNGPLTIEHPDGVVTVEEVGNGKRRVSIRPKDAKAYLPLASVVTWYPFDLIKVIVDAKGPVYCGDEISRDEGEGVQADLHYGLFSFVNPLEFEKARVLDFGCGSGASTILLKRMLPTSRLVGIDLEQRLLTIASRRAEHYGYEDLEFQRVEDPENVPSKLGRFDFIVLSAVYEHLLPSERSGLLPKLWRMLEPEGVLFINQTPHRYSPLEVHTTRLPLINYLPDVLALGFARHFSTTVKRDEHWEELLRRGIRGATAAEISGQLEEAGMRAERLRPQRLGMRDEIDVFCRLSEVKGRRRMAAAFGTCARLLKSMTGVVFTPTLTLAFRKREDV